MTLVKLVELDVKHIVGINAKVITFAHSLDSKCEQIHCLRDQNGLDGCLESIFFKVANGYAHQKIEILAGLILYRIAQGQYFIDGNKRTALLSCYYFLRNNSLDLAVNDDETNGLIWGFAEQNINGSKRKTQEDAIKWVYDNVIPK